MLTSFADLVAMSPHPFSRPVLKTDGPMVPHTSSKHHLAMFTRIFVVLQVIKAGRHPVISSQAVQQLTSSFVANDLFMSPLDNMHVITGPNGAGKV